MFDILEKFLLIWAGKISAGIFIFLLVGLTNDYFINTFGTVTKVKKTICQ